MAYAFSAKSIDHLPSKFMRCVGIAAVSTQPPRFRSMRVAIGVALVLLLPAVAASSAPPFRSLLGKIIRAQCHLDVCIWFSIEASAPAGESAAGSLLHVTIKDWSSVHPNGDYTQVTNRKLVTTSDEYVLCSRTKPAVIYTAPDKPGWYASRIFPDRAAKILPFNEGLYVRYWAACHGVAVADPGAAGARFGANLGYHTTPTSSDEEVKLDSPEAALLW